MRVPLRQQQPYQPPSSVCTVRVARVGFYSGGDGSPASMSRTSSWLERLCNRQCSSWDLVSLSVHLKAEI